MQSMHYRVSLKNTLIILALASITSACSTQQPSKPLNIDPTWAPIANSSHSAQLTQLLTAEFTLQRQGSEFASPLYLEAAQQSDQAAVAKRATSSAIMSDDNDAVLKASARWLELDPHDANIYPIRLQALLVEGDTNSAAELLQQALDSQVSLAFLPNFIDQNIRQTDITERTVE